MILIDSDILIRVLRNHTKTIDQFEETVAEFGNDLFITPIQYLEILPGSRQKERIDTEIFLDSLTSIDITTKIGKLAGDYMNFYAKSHGIHNADALIAASAKIHNLKVWTNNLKHYPMLKEAGFFHP
jgi:predicted nucleic acid-binding protein